MEAADRAGARQASATIKAAEIAARSQQEAMDKQIAYQQKGLDYLIKSEKLPMQYRDAALSVMGDLYGTGPGQESTAESFLGSPLAERLTTDQGQLVDKAKSSPLYAALMGTKKAGEEAIMRQAGATGGLRSGNVNENLYDYNTQLGKESLMTT